MNKHLTALTLAALGLALAGCPTAGVPIDPNATPSGAAAPTATPTAATSPAATASSAPLPSSSPMGPGPVGGSLQDVEKAVGAPVRNQYAITFTTTQGDFVVTLFPDRAVKASAKFKLLVDEGVYTNTTFHRVIPGFVAQGGDPLSKTLPANDPRVGTGTYGEAVPDDFGNGLKHLPGAVAFAHSSAPNSSYSQFYVCLKALPTLDNGYTVFGQVTQGFDTVLRLKATGNGVTPDRILKVTLAE